MIMNFALSTNIFPNNFNALSKTQASTSTPTFEGSLEKKYLSRFNANQKSVIEQLNGTIENSNKLNLREIYRQFRGMIGHFRSNVSSRDFFADIAKLKNDENYKIKCQKLEEIGTQIKKCETYQKKYSLQANKNELPENEQKYLNLQYYRSLKDEKKKYAKEINNLVGIRTAYIQSLPESYKKHIGDCFEDIAASEIDRKFLPQIAKKIAKKELKAELETKPSEEELKQRAEKISKQLVHLRNVRKGPIEFDDLILRVKTHSASSVNFPEVVAVVESKYGLPNVIEGYHKRKQNLLFINGESNIPVEKKVSKAKFKNLKISDGQKTYNLSPASFKNLNPAKNPHWYKSLYFVSTYRNPEDAFKLEQLNDEFFENFSKKGTKRNLLLINNNFSDVTLADLFVNRALNNPCVILASGN